MRNYISEGVAKVNEVQELVASKKEFITKQIINAILVLIIMVVFGCFDFAHPSFHLEYLADINFWSGTLGKLVAIICAYNVGINFIIDDVIKKNQTLLRNKEDYEALNAYRQKDFASYVYNIFNKQLKITAYKSKINRQIYLLNKISRRKDRLLYSSDDPEAAVLKQTNKYCIKRAELEGLMSDDFIEKNINNLNVRYSEVDPTVFDLEVDAKAKNKTVRVKGSIAKGRALSTSSVVLVSVSIAAFTTALVLEPNKQEFEDQTTAALNYCLHALADAGTIIWQLFHGMLNAKDIVSSQLTQSYAGRNLVLKSYWAWRMEKGEWVPNAYKDMLEEVKYVEVTKDQLKELNSMDK